jgi:hypothetical protein
LDYEKKKKQYTYDKLLAIEILTQIENAVKVIDSINYNN